MAVTSSPPAAGPAGDAAARRSRALRVLEVLALRRRRGKRSGLARLPLRRWLLITVVLTAVVAAAAIAAGALAIARLADARSTLVDQVDPALRTVQQLSTALVDQQSGLRGYRLTGQLDFLTPYLDGWHSEERALAALRGLSAGDGLGQLTRNVGLVEAAAARWRTDVAEPTIAAVRGSTTVAPVSDETGKAEFDAVRATVSATMDDLSRARAAGRAGLDRAAAFLVDVFAAAAAALVGLIAAVFGWLRSAVTRPVSALAGEVRAVASGEVNRAVTASGPREIVDLAADVDAMRSYIVRELDTQQQLARELQRSNSDLEQFAYVASHDLQEPLRKVASFCQLLEKRYAGSLDERGEQYIGFAVDGAKRMQVLINDLLAFSRVGRTSGATTEVDCEAVLAAALANLASLLESTGAAVTHDPLPRVHGEASLLTTVFQNLVGNAVKFRGAVPPRVHVGVRRDGGYWTFSVTDNGIGIDPEYAEKIFVIFQRLHPRDAYPGTGIGLAMCRKIVEYHDGRIWLDTTTAVEGASGGARFCFTLPALEDGSP